MVIDVKLHKGATGSSAGSYATNIALRGTTGCLQYTNCRNFRVANYSTNLNFCGKFELKIL